MTSPLRAPRPIRSAPEPRPVLHVVGDPVRRVRPGVILAVSMVVVFVTLLSSAVAHSLLVSGQVHLDDVARQVTAEREALQQDQLRLATSLAPERIAREATAIGMVPAGDTRWIVPGSPPAPVVTDGAGATDDHQLPAPPDAPDPAQLALDGPVGAGEPG